MSCVIDTHNLILTYRRVSLANPHRGVCEICREVKETAVCEIWCDADLNGYLKRICEDCGAGMAAG